MRLKRVLVEIISFVAYSAAILSLVFTLGYGFEICCCDDGDCIENCSTCKRDVDFGLTHSHHQCHYQSVMAGDLIVPNDLTLVYSSVLSSVIIPRIVSVVVVDLVDLPRSTAPPLGLLYGNFCEIRKRIIPLS